MDNQPVITRFFRRFPVWLFIVLALLLGSFELGRQTVYQSHPELSTTEQAATILRKVGELIQLPTGETPNMATINDVAAAKKTQPFLVNAENGDVLIVYNTAAQAILYRPSSHKLIAVGPVNTAPVNQGATGQKSIPTVTSKNATTTQ